EQAIDGGEARRLTTEPAELYGWLINPTRTHATLGYPAYIVPYDAQRRRIVERAPFGGCEPYFTHDGSAAYWVAGAGGPLRRLDLATGETTTLIRKFDERLPEGFGYLYFPMTSADSSLLVWGASEGEHDQFQANYEIFAAPAEPATLQLVGEPVRLTEESGPDRFPTVFARPRPLGRQRGEAPWTARFAAPGAGRWEFDFGDGAQATGGAVEHRYTQPGVYSVVARQGEQERVGQVRVLPAAPPRPQSATLAADAGAILVRFDEPVGTEGVEARLESGAAIAAIEAGADERELRFVLAEPRDGFDQIHLSRAPDRAEPPHVLAAAPLPLEVPRWPSRREDLVLLWENGEAANLVADPDGGAERAVSLVPTGGALLDHHFRMRLGRGSFRIAD